MPLFKLLIKDALSEGEILPYEETDLNRLLPHDGEAEGNTEDENGEALQPLENLEGLFTVYEEEPQVTTVQEKAEAILAEARHQAEVLKQEGHQQGLARGQEEGREEAKKELLPSLYAFAQAGQSLIVLEEQLVARMTPEIARLALEIAEKILLKQVNEDPEVVARVLERARLEIPHARHVQISLNPTDYETLVKMQPELVLVEKEGGRKVEVTVSEKIGRGGCRIETELGVVEATIPSQMQEIRKQMLDEE